MNANRAARRALRRVVDEQPGQQTTAMLLAMAANSLAENLDALLRLAEIGQNKRNLE